MKSVSSSVFTRRCLTLGRKLLAVFVVSAAWLEAGHDGPVPAPVDAFGGPGPYQVLQESFPCPQWAGQVVTVFRPVDAPGRRPAWFFAHGFGGSDPTYYRELLEHLASHGAVAVFSPYPASLLDVANNYSTLFSGFAAAAERYADEIDTTRVIFAGHSYGGGAVPAIALRAVRERGWGSRGLGLLMLAPWYCHLISDADLASFPSGTQAVVQVYEDDTMNDHRMAIDVFTHLTLPAADKDYLLVRSDRIEGYNYAAGHNVPTGVAVPRPGVAFNALDTWGVLRIAQALGAAVFDGDPAGRAVALGNGSPEQTRMGATPQGRALRPMVATDSPVPLFPSTRYIQAYDRPLNPRRTATLPSADNRPRLTNLSARAWSGAGDDVLIAGAVIDGQQPKSLLVRAVGPGLVSAGVNTAMADPRLVTFRGTAADLEIDNWAESPDLDALAATTADTGAATLAEGSRDAALLASFSPGVWTAHASTATGAPGIVLLELYDADLNAATRLLNLSARARIDAGDAVLIAGFVVDADAPVRVLVRGIGPTLAAQGVAGTLRDVRLEVYRGSTRIAANENWSDDSAQAGELAEVAAQVGAFPLPSGSTDAALLLTLERGVYTAHVRSTDGSSGIGLAEVYLVP